MATAGNRDEAKTLQDSQINKALGLFLLVFASVLLVATLFTDTTIGRLTNLGAGAVIGAIGGIMVWKGLKGDRSRRRARVD